jgi:siroheme synthase (precorrin-2 oxidase/ferrochelatase)
MIYPGNENLAEEIRERILNTFRQTLELAEKGDQREAQLGCDFVERRSVRRAPWIRACSRVPWRAMR